MKLCRKQHKIKATQKISHTAYGNKRYIQPDPAMEHRFSYKVDIIRCNHPYHPDFLFPLPFSGYYINHANPITAHQLAFQRTAELPYDAKLNRYGALYAKVYFIDEQEQDCRLIWDMRMEPTNEICGNLEYEYVLLNRLGFEIPEWELITAPNGVAHRVIRSEFGVAEVCSEHFKQIIATESSQLESLMNNKP